jgi:hypothetical protein
LDIVAIFWLHAVELNIFDMRDHLAIRPVVVSHNVQRTGRSPFQSVYRHTQKPFQSPLVALD